jgi:hypothetical protein
MLHSGDLLAIIVDKKVGWVSAIFVNALDDLGRLHDPIFVLVIVVKVMILRAVVEGYLGSLLRHVIVGKAVCGLLRESVHNVQWLLAAK